MLSNTGTFQLDVQVLQAAAVHNQLATSYTCASVAIAVQVLVAVVVLLGTTGEVENVLVQAIV